MTRMLWAEGGFSACLAAHGRRRSLPWPLMTILTASVGIFERLGRGSEIGGAVCAASQKRKNAAAGVRTFREWRRLSA
jgi:hypothetical protein